MIKIEMIGGKYLSLRAETWHLYDDQGPIRQLNTNEARMVRAAYDAPSPNTVDLLEEIAQLQAKNYRTEQSLVAAEETIKQLGERNEKLVVCYAHRTEERDDARRFVDQFAHGMSILKSQTRVMSSAVHYEQNAEYFSRAEALRSALGWMTGTSPEPLEKPERWANDVALQRVRNANLRSWASCLSLWGAVIAATFALWGMK